MGRSSGENWRMLRAKLGVGLLPNAKVIYTYIKFNLSKGFPFVIVKE